LPKILELEQHVADLIAAGEVVQRPASVVKELIENAIDAGAGIITIEISSGGMTFIRITDNGCGIAASDVKTAFLRHATSKLRDAHGLEAIGTLGFRGEALAAIAAVSRIELLTRETGSTQGVSLTLKAGEVIDMSPAGCPEGTTIIVRDLFYNTPARLKFIKSDRAEASSVAAVVMKCALSRPDISMRYIKDGKTEYHTPGDSRIDSVIYSLLGRELEASFLRAEASDETVFVKGFVSSPSAVRGNRSYQFFFVNGRAIRSLLLQSALEQAYKNTIPSGRFPSCVLYITIKPGDVDVNVHPAKAEVKFVSEKQVFDGIYYAALGAIDSEHGEERIEKEEDRRSYGAKSSYGGPISIQTDIFNDLYISEPNKPYKSHVRSIPFETISFSAQSSCDPLPPSLPPSLPVLFIGEAFNVYIIVEYENSVWFIDKHAAHERIHFDALKKCDYEPMSETLITPVICRPGHEDTSVLLENTGLLDKLGFTVEGFGEDTVAVRHIPSEIDIDDVEFVLSEICVQLKQSGVAEHIMKDSIYKTIACRAAIKAGRASGSRELEILAERVLSGELSHCPHGRNVAFAISKTTLDKSFGR